MDESLSKTPGRFCQNLHHVRPATALHDCTELVSSIRQWGRELGFQQVGITGIELPEDEARLMAGWSKAVTAPWITWTSRPAARATARAGARARCA